MLMPRQTLVGRWGQEVWPLLNSVPSVACGSRVSCRPRMPPLTGVRQKACFCQLSR